MAADTDWGTVSVLRSHQTISITDLEAGEKLSGNMKVKTASAMTF